jgi:anti-sigma factor RsiW
MTDHLSPAILNALADGELSGEQLANANEHLAGCPHCTTSALSQSLLKSATARAGQRYSPSPHLLERLSHQTARLAPRPPGSHSRMGPGFAQRLAAFGWIAAAAMLLVSVSLVLLQRKTQQATIASALATEVFDQHVATLAASLPPQVLSSENHTVKPWFQGKIPFSFNLPEGLPSDTTLDGANLAYLNDRPVAQLLYRIGKHRVSVFVTARADKTSPAAIPAEHAGFHVMSFGTDALEVIAISDVNPARLADLVRLFEQSQR